MEGGGDNREQTRACLNSHPATDRTLIFLNTRLVLKANNKFKGQRIFVVKRPGHALPLHFYSFSTVDNFQPFSAEGKVKQIDVVVEISR